MVRRFGVALVAATLLMTAAGCATTSGRLYVRSGPPRVVAERRLVVPGQWAHDRHGWYFIESHWRY